MAKHKSLLMTYIKRKHAHESASALFTLTVLVMLIAALAAPALMLPQIGSQHNVYPSTGLASGQSEALVAIWLLVLVLLLPVEMALRKR
ncbi:MAG: hypothetical protein QW548_00550 [Candidatus Aenigmatarchaeota archaeon]